MPSPWCPKKCGLVQARDREFLLGQRSSAFVPAWLTRPRFMFRHVSNDYPGCFDKLVNQIFTYSVILNAAFIGCRLGTGLCKVKDEGTTRKLESIPVF
jgi:hypothetical protein